MNPSKKHLTAYVRSGVVKRGKLKGRRLTDLSTAALCGLNGVQNLDAASLKEIGDEIRQRRVNRFSRRRYKQVSQRARHPLPTPITLGNRCDVSPVRRGCKNGPSKSILKPLLGLASVNVGRRLF